MPDSPGTESASRRPANRWRAIVLMALLFGLPVTLAMLVQGVHSQSSPAAPFPTRETFGVVGTSSAPVNVFYVSPLGVDPCSGLPNSPPTPAATPVPNGPTPCSQTLCGGSVIPIAPTPPATAGEAPCCVGTAAATATTPIVPNLCCPATNPCATPAFAIALARDGDQIALAGGLYQISSPMVIDKLITIANLGFGPTSSALPSTSISTSSSTCISSISVPPSSPQTCTLTLATAVGVGGSATITLAVSGASGVPLFPTVPNSLGTCPLASSTPSADNTSVTVVYSCGVGQSSPAGQIVSFPITFGTVVATGVSVTAQMTLTPSTNSLRPVLRSTNGLPVFIVTAVGAPSLHVVIFGLELGNAYSNSGQGAIVLQHDSWTEVAKNIIGAGDLPDGIGILSQGSNHPIIHDNTIQGGGQYPFVPFLKPGPNVGGFGIVTGECLGSADRTNGLQIYDNILTGNSNAGLWLCSNGAGGNYIGGNTLLNNGRGMVFWDAVDNNIELNNVSNNIQDGIDVLDHSEHNLLRSNTVESQAGPTSVGILLAGDGAFFPLGNQLRENLIHRNTIDVELSGAQGTQFIDNAMTAIDGGTDVLLSPGGANIATSQPIGTLMQGNAIQANGLCTATQGCAIRLAAGVVASVDASGNNDFGGQIDPLAIQTMIWDHGHDPSLGIVYQVAPPPTVQAIPGSLGQPTPTPGTQTATPRPTVAPAVPPTPLPTTAPPPTPAATATPAPSSSAPVYHVDPATSDYYVTIAFCVTDAQDRPVPNDVVTINFFDASGAALGPTTINTDAGGCFSGNVAPDSSGDRTREPAQILATDPAGTSVGSPVVAGSPVQLPPRTPIQ